MLLCGITVGACSQAILQSGSRASTLLLWNDAGSASLSEECGAHAHLGAAGSDGGGEVATHAHR